MAVITKIEEQKNKKRVNIFVDDAFFCGLSKETAVIFKFKVGLEIDENLLKEAVFDSEVKRAFEKASDYLSVRMHTKKELFEKLLKKGYEKEVILITLAASALAFWRHRKNIKNLLNGTENRFGSKKK